MRARADIAVGATAFLLAAEPARGQGGLFNGLLSLGYVLYVGPAASLSPGIGVRGSLGFADSSLDSFYGTQVPVGAMGFVQLRPARMAMRRQHDS